MLGLDASRMTDSARRILEQIGARASDRGLHVVDSASIVWLALFSLLLWERKVGRMALERIGVNAFELARSVDALLEAKVEEHPVVYDQRQGIAVHAKTGEPHEHSDIRALLEPLLKQAENEASDLGHNYIGSEHLALAIVRLADPSLAALLQEPRSSSSGPWRGSRRTP